MYSAFANSGEARIGSFGEDTATTVQSGVLEQSNVDLSQEFTKMIISQRGFQANARVITTSDAIFAGNYESYKITLILTPQNIN